MNKEKIKPILKGIIKNIPGIKYLLPQGDRGTISSRYYYSVWMRHLINVSDSVAGVPNVVTELGPGHSIGAGLAALLSGCECYYALDAVKLWDAERNLKIFDELLAFFIKKEKIPDNREFSLLKPILDDYSFPSNILTEEHLKKSLSDKRIERIRKEIKDIDKKNEGKFIKYYIPWNDSSVIKNNSVDFIFSQSVLEYVGLEVVYQAMNAWLKPNGMMSHEIDFKCLGDASTWNGHWTFSDFEWKIVTGTKQIRINRMPLTKHIECQNKYGFKIIKKNLHKRNSQLTREMLSKRFKNLTDEDLSTSGMYIVSMKQE